MGGRVAALSNAVGSTATPIPPARPDSPDEILLQIRFNGASNNGGYHRIDNVLIEALPAPGTIAPLALACSIAGFRRRRPH